MTSLQFFGGVAEIGGNKILIEDEGARVWLDFGQSFTMGCDYFVGWLQPQTHSGLGDYFEFDLMPKLRDLYAEPLLINTPISYEEPRFDAFFLSHAHFDHVDHIRFLDPPSPPGADRGQSSSSRRLRRRADTSTTVNMSTAPSTPVTGSI